MRKAQDVAVVYDAILGVGGVVDRTREGRHHVIYWRIGEKQFVTTVAKSSSDWRALRNKIAQIKAAVRITQNSEVSRVA